MFKHIIIGQYLPGQSFLHRMDARAKLAAVFLLIIVLFLVHTWKGYGLAVIGACGLFFLAGVPFRYIRKGMYPILIFVVFSFLLHAFFTQEGDILVSVGVLTIYTGGLEKGVFISLRLLLLVFVTSLLTLTTSPVDLTDALERILTPLKRLGVPAHEIALMMSIAIRFIPTLLQETEKIIKAQTARGADFGKGSLTARAQAFVSLLVPLFVRAFKRAEDLAIAMEARGYDGGRGRTKFRQLTWQAKDSAACIVIVIFGIAMVIFQG
ncbi:energy-coupling factor transporter transmembrane component T family protein [Bacillus piscicola]|uniref:energy-coupling factor transporter transmembrane component T family protein n=1 Tax=Bacillus piscicola TaxID=1632684 RepID=UPI001F09A806|nr:energy-coupling factor transporter transmembrane component T [Bacillus piscicola]